MKTKLYRYFLLDFIAVAATYSVSLVLMCTAFFVQDSQLSEVCLIFSVLIAAVSYMLFIVTINEMRLYEREHSNGK